MEVVRNLAGLSRSNASFSLKLPHKVKVGHVLTTRLFHLWAIFEARPRQPSIIIFNCQLNSNSPTTAVQRDISGTMPKTKRKPTDWSKWRKRKHPWVKGRDLTTAEDAEVMLFKMQDRFRVEREQRREAFEEKMRLAKEAFELSEHETLCDILYPFAHQLWVCHISRNSASACDTDLEKMYEGIDEIRKHAVPAYTFTKFPDLPPEIQLRIWSLAARTEEPQVHYVVAMIDDELASSWNWSYFSYELEGSSRIKRDSSRSWDPKPVPTVLHVSRDSRMVAQKIYTRLCFSKYSSAGAHPDREAYINTLYDSFYIGHKEWSDFKILVDMSTKLNTTRPLHKLVQRDLKRFQNIRFFIVDFNIFGAAPPRIWAEFNKLDKLTIAIYPHKTISNPERPPYTDEPSFIRPHRCYTHGKRVVWLHQAALDLLQSVKDHDVPQWKIPDVEVVVRRTGRADADDDVQEEWVDEDISDEEYYDMEELTDNSVW
jgi:hypothetical protein